MAKPHLYPFSALIGQEKMKTALLLNTVDPGIGGVLISGHKGTGKSTAVRALTQVLPPIEAVADCPYQCPPTEPQRMCPDCLSRFQAGSELPVETRAMPLVELPLSATEDRVVGTLHIEETLKSGKRHFEPGLLAAANRGILYVDEVNLLDDHLVDILLDAAASGINVIEREGVSFSHPARFILAGTMNPEEGELRPQFLDRFGLSLVVGSVADPVLRRRIVSRRLAFDQDPEGFVAGWSAEEAILANQVLNAGQMLDQIAVAEELIGLAVSLAARAEVQGHRAEIAIIKAARALAALMDESEVRREHIVEAARFVLLHRLTAMPLAAAGLLEERIEELLAEVLERRDDDQRKGARGQDPGDSWDEIDEQVPGSNAASNVDMLFSFLEEKKKSYLRPTN